MENGVKNVLIKKEYFDNINTVITSINGFFSSEFKTKDFPTGGDAFIVDPTILEIMGWLNAVDPTWVNNPEKIDTVVDAINASVENAEEENPYEFLENSNNTVVLDQINAYVGYMFLQLIGDHFEEFSSLINGIYSFELFLDPGKFYNAIDILAQPIDTSPLDDVLKETQFSLFSAEKYISGVFSNNTQITLPEDLKQESELARFQNGEKSEYTVVVDDTVTEAAEVNLFEKARPNNFKYDAKSDTFKVSVQYRKKIEDFLSGLEKCNTTAELKEFFANEKNFDADYPGFMVGNVLPFVLAKVYNNQTKYPFDNFNVDSLSKFIKSYKSILEKNNGSKRFGSYDLFTTFKIDKEGTMQFLKDFLLLDLYNKKDVVIGNNTLLTVFNIFDSRIYFDILYNVIPDDVKKEKFETEDQFVKDVRRRVNSNSRTANVYKKTPKDDATTSSEVLEFSLDMLRQFGDMEPEDMAYCEQFGQVLKREINCLDDQLFNNNLQSVAIARYLGDLDTSFYQEGETGALPDYMQNRIEMTDDMGLPPEDDFGLPKNSASSLADSIDARMSGDGSLEDMLGEGADKKAGVVYNITNTYNNSFNRDSGNTTTHTTNDSSTGKTTTNTNTNSHNDSSSNKMVNSRTHAASNNTGEANNNNNSTVTSDDTKDSLSASFREYYSLSSGVSMTDLFAFLESEEPLSEASGDAGSPPKGDLLTAAMDVDRKTLPLQQKLKKGGEKAINIGKAVTKPISHVKHTLTKLVDSMIKRDENTVKAEIIENPSYRTNLYKATRLALKVGMFGIAWTINGYLAAAYAVMQGAKLADRQRLKKEVQEEFGAELEIIDDKIEKADKAGDNKAKWQMMRMRSKLAHIAGGTTKRKLVSRSSAY